MSPRMTSESNTKSCRFAVEKGYSSPGSRMNVAGSCIVMHHFETAEERQQRRAFESRGTVGCLILGAE